MRKVQALAKQLMDHPAVRGRTPGSDPGDHPLDNAALPPELRRLVGILPASVRAEEYQEHLREKYGPCGCSSTSMLCLIFLRSGSPTTTTLPEFGCSRKAVQ